MITDVEKTLKRLITQQGLAIVKSPHRLQAMLYDLCPGNRREIRILMVALEEGVLDVLTQEATEQLDQHVFKHITTKLHRDTGIEISLIEGAVACWVQTLGKKLPPRRQEDTPILQTVGVPQSGHQLVQVNSHTSMSSQVRPNTISVTPQSPGRSSSIWKIAVSIALVLTVIIVFMSNLGESTPNDGNEDAGSTLHFVDSEPSISSDSSATKHTMAIANDDTSFIFPYSSEKRLTERDLAGLNAKQLRIARNEIFARHGYRFKSEDLQQYFAAKSWYKMDDSYSGAINEIEEYNVNLIKAWEEVAY